MLEKRNACEVCGGPCDRRARRCHPCYGKSRRGKFVGDLSPCWKGGRNISPNGYVRIKVIPGGPYVWEHRYVMEQVLGRVLRSDEHVHHKNGVKDDNRPENLQIVSNHEHGEIHARERGSLTDEQIIALIRGGVPTTGIHASPERITRIRHDVLGLRRHERTAVFPTDRRPTD